LRWTSPILFQVPYPSTINITAATYACHSSQELPSCFVLYDSCIIYFILPPCAHTIPPQHVLFNFCLQGLQVLALNAFHLHSASPLGSNTYVSLRPRTLNCIAVPRTPSPAPCNSDTPCTCTSSPLTCAPL
jgi:hypothetical protein